MTSDAEADLPPYDPQRILSAPFPERVRLVCRTWASQVAPNPFIVVVLCWAKYFLLSMRYYAGNWAYNIWLFRKGATRKLDRLTKPAGTMRGVQPWPTGEYEQALLRPSSRPAPAQA